MLKNVTQLKCIVNGKEMLFVCDMDSTTIEAKEGLYQFLKFVGKIEDVAKEKQEKEQQIESPAVMEEENCCKQEIELN